MPSHIKKTERGRGRSAIACHSCRRRKVKCDRRFPQCLVCEENALKCDYPPGPLKPGPKIGSLQRPKKRTREDADSRNGECTTAVPRRDGILSDLDEHPSLPASGILSSQRTTRCPTGGTHRRTVPCDASEWNVRRSADLSFILHPSHEGSSPEMESRSNAQWSVGNKKEDTLEKACITLGITQAALKNLIGIYFDNMVAINLFHEPSFADKLNEIYTPTQISALLAGMLCLAVRFYEGEGNDIGLSGDWGEVHQQSAYFLEQALKLIDEALQECSDSTPPLCILQASILATYCQLSQGVLGRAWRSLGTCIRLAYEMNLHLIDTRAIVNTTTVDVEQWCKDEEKRRAWWTVWEMDVFASTIRRTPPAVDWSQIETLLPVQDEDWFQCNPRRSCFLERDPVYRWKSLQDSGSQSPKSWYIVINSLVKDAQRISSPRGVPISSPNEATPATSNEDDGLQADIGDGRQKLEIIANAVQCFRLAVPNHLKYHNQYLGFEPRIPGQHLSNRQSHSSIYNIYMMTQLAKLMIYRYDVFNGRPKGPLATDDSIDPLRTNNTRGGPDDRNDEADSVALQQYFDAADDMLTIVRRSCDDHIRYINPFLSNTIWLASAVHLVRSQLCQSGMARSTIKSRFEVMNLTYKKCVEFWNMHPAVQQNLEMLEEQVEACQKSSSKAGLHQPDIGYTQTAQTKQQNQISDNNRISSCHTTGVSYEFPASGMHSTENGNPGQQSRYPAQPFPSPPSSHNACMTVDETDILPSPLGIKMPSESTPDFGFLPLESITCPPPQSPKPTDPIYSLSSPQTYGGPFSSLGTMSNNGMCLDWAQCQVPGDIQDIFSGFFT